jgi:phage terminase small subunit
MALTDKQEAFCQQYIIDFNGTQAAIRAGYSEATANEQASRLLANVSIQERLNELKQALSEKTGVTAQMVVNELAKIAFSDPREMFTVDNNLVGIRQMGDKEAGAIASVEVEALFEGSGQDRMEIGTTTKIKLWDKPRALDSLAKYFGIYERDNKQKQPVLNLPTWFNDGQTKS